jgi:hypothetical protein
VIAASSSSGERDEYSKRDEYYQYTNISYMNSFRFVKERVTTTVGPATAFASGQRIDR